MPTSSSQAKLDTDWDVIVVGSGLGGLSTAARLATWGLRVLVLEQHVCAGGYAHHFLRKVRGTKIVYDFDAALHQTGDLAPGRVMHGVLSDLGILERIGLHRFDIAYRSRGPAHDHRIPADADAYEQLLAEAYPEHAIGVRDLFATMRRIDAGRHDGPSPEAFESMGMTLQELVERHVKDERILHIFSTLWSYQGLVPSQLSAFSYAKTWCSFHLGGCFYIRGGSEALSNAFVDVIEENRGRVLLSTEVTGISTQAGRIVGVETARRGSFRAPVVVSNAAAPLTFDCLLDHPEIAAADRKVASALPLAVSVHQAYVGIRGDASALGMADRGSFLATSYDLEAEGDALKRGDYRSQGWITANYSLADPGHSPQGRSILTAATLADGSLWSDLDEPTYRERKRDLQEYLVDRLAEEIPDIRERIEVVETGTPRTMERYTSNPMGSIYGYTFNVNSHSIHRPQPRTSVPGLYLAGAWTFPGAGFEGAMLSGQNTAKLVMEDTESGPPS